MEVRASRQTSPASAFSSSARHVRSERQRNNTATLWYGRRCAGESAPVEESTEMGPTEARLYNKQDGKLKCPSSDESSEGGKEQCRVNPGYLRQAESESMSERPSM
jgi:hypothetical protein